jgi:hypothetical protein
VTCHTPSSEDTLCATSYQSPLPNQFVSLNAGLQQQTFVLWSLTCSAKYTLLPQRGHWGVPLPHCRAGLPVGVERNSPISPAPYRVPVVLETNGATLGVPEAPFTPSESVRPRVAESLEVGDARFVGEAAARSEVPVSGTVRGSPPSARPVCDGVNCESSLPWSVPLSVPSVCSGSGLKATRVGLSTRVGRRSGPGELVASPKVPVSFRLMGEGGNKGPLRPDAWGESSGGLATRRWGEEGGAPAAREGDRDVCLVL